MLQEISCDSSRLKFVNINIYGETSGYLAIQWDLWDLMMLFRVLWGSEESLRISGISLSAFCRFHEVLHLTFASAFSTESFLKSIRICMNVLAHYERYFGGFRDHSQITQKPLFMLE